MNALLDVRINSLFFYKEHCMSYQSINIKRKILKEIIWKTFGSLNVLDEMCIRSASVSNVKKTVFEGCLENGDLKLFGIHNGSIVVIVDRCKNESLIADNFSVFTVPSKCFNTSQVNKKTLRGCVTILCIWG